MDAVSVGFDPVLALQAGASMPLFALCLRAAKGLAVVPPRLEVLLAFALTAAVGTIVSVQSGAALLLPALSSSACGAVLAMVLHAALFKGDPPAGANSD